MSEGDVSQPRRSLPDSRWTAMPHPRIASPHGCNYRLIPVPINPGGWSSRQTPSPRPIRQLCRSHSLMFETDRAHTKCMCVLSEEKMFSADFVVFSPSRGPQVLCRAKIPRAAPVATWRANIIARVARYTVNCTVLYPYSSTTVMERNGIKLEFYSLEFYWLNSFNSRKILRT